MIVSLGITGKSVCMSIESYLAMSDEDLNMMTAHESGYVINSPYADTALIDLSSGTIEEIDVDELGEDDLFEESELEELLENQAFDGD